MPFAIMCKIQQNKHCTQNAVSHNAVVCKPVPQAPLPCTFCMSDTPKSGLAVSTNELMSVCLIRKTCKMCRAGVLAGQVWKPQCNTINLTFHLQSGGIKNNISRFLSHYYFIKLLKVNGSSTFSKLSCNLYSMPTQCVLYSIYYIESHWHIFQNIFYVPQNKVSPTGLEQKHDAM